MLESIKTDMQKFNTLKSIPAYLPIVNIDTDMIIPKQFLKTIKRTGLGKNLFFEMRYDDNGKEIDEFTLNKKPFNNSKILIAGKNFGCGSSREHAPWALLDFGITCVISSSFADIFYSNCFKNGILPITLDEEKIIFGNNEVKFQVDSFKRKCLLEGLDDIALSLKKSDKIIPFIGMPGCARSQKENGVDWILWRLFCGLGISNGDINHMGNGGLL